jgi:two-component system NtrC family sensor kinase
MKYERVLRNLSSSAILIATAALCFVCNMAFSQNRQIDSLKNLVLKADENLKIKLYNALSKEYRAFNYDTSAVFAREALKISLATNDSTGEAEAYRNIALANHFTGKTPVEPYLRRALHFFKLLGNRKGIADCYNNFGLIYSHSGLDSARVYFDSAVQIFHSLNDVLGEAAALNYIGIVLQEKGEYQNAVDYALKGLALRKSTNDYRGIIYSLINVGNIYLEAEKFDIAIDYYNQSIAFANEHEREPENMVFNQLGKTYLQLKQYQKAEEQFHKASWADDLLVGRLYNETNRLDDALKKFSDALMNSQKSGSKVYATGALTGLADSYLKKGNLKLAIKNGLQAYALADSIDHKKNLENAASVLARAYQAIGNYERSNHFLHIAFNIHDSLKNGQIQSRLAFFESKAKSDSEQARIQVITAQNALQQQKLNDEQKYRTSILIFSALALLAAIAIIIFINGKRKRIQAQSIVIDEQKHKVEKTLSELISTQSQLIQKEKMASLGELTAGIAHEIQNPLNFVNNFSEINKDLVEELTHEIEKGNLQEAKNIARDIVHNEIKINEHGKRADSIVKGMLQHSRSSTGIKEATKLNILADEYLRLAYHGIRAKDKSFNVNVKTDFDDAIGQISLVPQEFGRVLLNLLNNAFYSIGEKKKSFSAETKSDHYNPTVLIATKKEKDNVIITVSDNGIGIPDKLKDKIFQPFFTTKPAGQGTGLGLSLAYDIIKAHGGNIRMESNNGDGAAFIIELPVK